MNQAPQIHSASRSDCLRPWSLPQTCQRSLSLGPFPSSTEVWSHLESRLQHQVAYAMVLFPRGEHASRAAVPFQHHQHGQTHVGLQRGHAASDVFLHPSVFQRNRLGPLWWSNLLLSEWLKAAKGSQLLHLDLHSDVWPWLWWGLFFTLLSIHLFRSANGFAGPGKGSQHDSPSAAAEAVWYLGGKQLRSHHHHLLLQWSCHLKGPSRGGHHCTGTSGRGQCLLGHEGNLRLFDRFFGGCKNLEGQLCV